VGGSDAARTACSSYSFLVDRSSSYAFCSLQKPEEDEDDEQDEEEPEDDDDEEEEQELQEMADGVVNPAGPIRRLYSSIREGILGRLSAVVAAPSSRSALSGWRCCELGARLAVALGLPLLSGLGCARFPRCEARGAPTPRHALHTVTWGRFVPTLAEGLPITMRTVQRRDGRRTGVS
jgi:hypothetical protein